MQVITANTRKKIGFKTKLVGSMIIMAGSIFLSSKYKAQIYNATVNRNNAILASNNTLSEQLQKADKTINVLENSVKAPKRDTVVVKIVDANDFNVQLSKRDIKLLGKAITQAISSERTDTSIVSINVINIESRKIKK